MALKDNINDREKDKFQAVDGKTAVRVVSANEANLFNAKKTEVTDSEPIKIDFPDEGTEFLLYHNTSSGIVWLGPDNTITAGSEGTAPLPQQPFTLPVRVVSGNDNNIWAISASGTIDVYVVGFLKE